MAARSSVSPAGRIFLVMLAVLTLTASEAMKTQILSYYLQQEFGNNELQFIPAARPPVNGTNSGFGQSVVYEFLMTETADPASNIMGYVRGIGVTVNNTAAGTVFFVTNVLHYDYKGVQGTLSQQGEAIFSAPSWEFVVVGGTGAFRHAYGYNVGSTVSFSRSHVTTHYEAHIRIGNKF